MNFIEDFVSENPENSNTEIRLEDAIILNETNKDKKMEMKFYNLYHLLILVELLLKLLSKLSILMLEKLKEKDNLTILLIKKTVF